MVLINGLDDTVPNGHLNSEHMQYLYVCEQTMESSLSSYLFIFIHAFLYDNDMNSLSDPVSLTSACVCYIASKIYICNDVNANGLPIASYNGLVKGEKYFRENFAFETQTQASHT